MTLRLQRHRGNSFELKLYLFLVTGDHIRQTRFCATKMPLRYRDQATNGLINNTMFNSIKPAAPKLCRQYFPLRLDPLDPRLQSPRGGDGSISPYPCACCSTPTDRPTHPPEFGSRDEYSSPPNTSPESSRRQDSPRAQLHERA